MPDQARSYDAQEPHTLLAHRATLPGATAHSLRRSRTCGPASASASSQPPRPPTSASTALRPPPPRARSPPRTDYAPNTGRQPPRGSSSLSAGITADVVFVSADTEVRGKITSKIPTVIAGGRRLSLAERGPRPGHTRRRRIASSRRGWRETATSACLCTGGKTRSRPRSPRPRREIPQQSPSLALACLFRGDRANGGVSGARARARARILYRRAAVGRSSPRRTA